MYDYLENVTADVRDYVEQEIDLSEWASDRDGFNTTVARNREFETVVNAFMYYNCTNETGKYPAYWKKEA